MRSAAVSAAACAVLAFARPAFAADGGGAAQLFDEAQRLMTAGDFAAACAKFEESQRLDPQLGTQLHLANCYEKRGLIASAYLNFRAAAELAAQRKEPREAVARRRAAALEAEVSTLRLHVEQPDTPGLQIQHDGQPLERTNWDRPLPVDPGSHRVNASAPGRRDFAQRYTLSGDRAHAVLSVPELSPLVAAEAAPPAPPAASTDRARPAADGGGIDGQKLAGYIVAGVGVAGLGVGGVFGLLRNAKVGDMEDACGSPCNVPADDPAKLQHVRELRREANGYATAATLGLAIGGAALVSGVVLVFTAPHEAAPEIAIGAAPGGFSVRGRIDAL